MALGLKGQMKSIHKDMERIRFSKNPIEAEFAGMRDITLLEYLTKKYKDGVDQKTGSFDIGHLYAELGINPDVMTVSQLIDLDQDSKWLVPEIFRDAIRKGLRSSPFYNRLIAASETVAQPQVNMPSIEMSDAEPQPMQQGESFSEGTISYGNKTVNIEKQGIGIKITDEAVQYTSINLLTIFIQDMGIKLGQKLNNAAIYALINGDQDGGTESAAVIGIENTQTGLIYSDLLYAWIRASRLGRLYNTFIGPERVVNTIMNLTEFKDKQNGTPQQSLVINEILPSQSQGFVSAQVPADQLILVDPRYALVQLTSSPLAVEGERIVNKQINGTYASITTGFGNIFRDARVIIDRSLQINFQNGTNDFPSWMNSTL